MNEIQLFAIVFLCDGEVGVRMLGGSSPKPFLFAAIEHAERIILFQMEKGRHTFFHPDAGAYILASHSQQDRGNNTLADAVVFVHPNEPDVGQEWKWRLTARDEVYKEYLLSGDLIAQLNEYPFGLF